MMVGYKDLSREERLVISDKLQEAATILGLKLYDFGAGIEVAPTVGKLNNEVEGFTFAFEK